MFVYMLCEIRHINYKQVFHYDKIYSHGVNIQSYMVCVVCNIEFKYIICNQVSNTIVNQ